MTRPDRLYGAFVLVCGGRRYDDKEQVFKTLDSVQRRMEIDTIIHGDALGADRLADLWAKSKGINVKACPADWDLYGKRAGIVRNTQMLKDWAPDLVVAFPGGTGTNNMVEQAYKAGVEIIIVS